MMRKGKSVRAASAVLAFAAVACAGPGVRFDDIPAPTVRSTWPGAGVGDDRVAFQRRFCAELARDAPTQACQQWLWRPPADLGNPMPPVPRLRVAPRRSLVILPGIFGECVAQWVTPFSADHDALEAMGFDVHVLPLRGRESSGQNARVIHAHLGDPRLALSDAIVIGYSKGTSDFMLAASQPEAAAWRGKVSAFVSVAGTPHGSPAANRAANLYGSLLARLPLDLCGAGDGGGVRSLTYAEAQRISAAFTASKPRFRTYSVIAVAEGVPVNPLLAGFHRWLSKVDQRNDGQVLLEDAVVPGSTVLGVFRADHWSIALPFEQSDAVLMRPLGVNNHFPRGALVRAIVGHIAPMGAPVEDRRDQ